MFRTRIVHTSGKLFDFLGVDLSIFWSKNIVKPCSHIELNTQNPNPNPNPILKITISFTKTPTIPKYFRNFGKKHRRNKKKNELYFVICINCIYFCNFGKFCKFYNFGILGFLFIYTYTCRSRYVVVSWCRDVALTKYLQTLAV